ncbi:MAG: RNA methyltransferase [Planctomycetota bacterium]|nr:MAG: RNA methyltransferase [Planctomycetota bacterium]
MVSRRKRGKRRAPVLGGDPQKAWIWGRHAVEETLYAGRWPILEFWMATSLPAERRAAYRERCDELKITCLEKRAEEICMRVHAADHQGLAAKMGPFPYVAWRSMFETLCGKSRADVVVLDRIQDPYNFGSMIRSAALFGMDAIVIGTREQVAVTSHVVRASAGLVNRIPVCRVPSLVDVLRELNDAAWDTVGMAMDAADRLDEREWGRRVAVVIGNEGAGLGEAIRAACSRLARIPHRADGCLNAAVACGIVCYELARHANAAGRRQ